jgi:hypothetical protein
MNSTEMKRRRLTSGSEVKRGGRSHDITGHFG